MLRWSRPPPAAVGHMPGSQRPRDGSSAHICISRTVRCPMVEKEDEISVRLLVFGSWASAPLVKPRPVGPLEACPRRRPSNVQRMKSKPRVMSTLRSLCMFMHALCEEHEARCQYDERSARIVLSWEQSQAGRLASQGQPEAGGVRGHEVRDVLSMSAGIS